MKRIARLVTLAILTMLLTVDGAVAASAEANTPALSASPTTIAVGETTALTATGLGDAVEIGFGLGDNDAGTFSAARGVSGYSSIDIPVSDGQATAYFLAAKTGSFFIDITDGETPLAQVLVTVTDPQPQPTQTSETPVIEVGSPLVVGQKVTVTGKVGGLQTVGFGLGSPDAGSFSTGGASGSSITANVTDGTATVDFTPARAGSVTIALSDGENVLASAVVEVSAASASPSATPTPTATPSATPAPAPVTESGSILPWILLVVALLVIAGSIVWLVLSRRRGTRGRTDEAVS